MPPSQCVVSASASPERLPMYAVTGFTASDYYATANPGGESGSNAGWGVAYAIRLLTNPATTRVVGGRSAWDLRLNTSNQLQLIDAGGASSPLITTSLMKWMHIAFVWDFSALKLRSYLSGVEVGVGSSSAAWAAGAAAAQYLGKRNDGFPIGAAQVSGMVTWTGVITPTELVAHYVSCKSNLDVAAITGVAVTPTHRWTARNDRAAIGTLTDLTGSSNMIATGSPSLYADNAPIWV